MTVVSYTIDRRLGERIKNGFVLETIDGEHTGEITDAEALKDKPSDKLVFKRMIDILDNHGFYLKLIDPKSESLLKSILTTTQTGGIFDKFWLDDVPFDVGDVLRITLIPREENKIVIKIEFHEEDQVREEEE